MFRSARIRLTAWYVLVLALIGVALGNIVYLTVRSQLRGGVDDGLHLVGQRAQQDVSTTYLRSGGELFPLDIKQLCADQDLQGLLSQGYQVVVASGGLACGPSPKATREVLRLPRWGAIWAARHQGSDLRTVHGGGPAMRVYSVPVSLLPAGQPVAVVQVARSLEPEDRALDKLLTTLAVGGTIGLLLSAVGGWFLAGKSLAPVRQAFLRQQAFVADASHELRTPLAVIRANAEYLQLEQPGNAEVANIVAETERLSSLVDALLALAHGDERRLPHEPLDLGELVAEAAASLRTLAADRGVELEIDARPGLEVRGDREQLRQLVVILADNALRYTGAGGRVGVQAGAQGGQAAIEVADTGIGIPPESLRRVFERFYRTDEARNRASGGAGLGLAIAQKLVEEHGGRIEATSEVGRGSTFTVLLPLLRGAAPSQGVASRTPA